MIFNGCILRLPKGWILVIKKAGMAEEKKSNKKRGVRQEKVLQQNCSCWAWGLRWQPLPRRYSKLLVLLVETQNFEAWTGWPLAEADALVLTCDAKNPAPVRQPLTRLRLINDSLNIVRLPQWLINGLTLGGGFKYIFLKPYLGKIPILTDIFQMGWNHQPAHRFANILGIRPCKRNEDSWKVGVPNRRPLGPNGWGGEYI